MQHGRRVPATFDRSFATAATSKVLVPTTELRQRPFDDWHLMDALIERGLRSQVRQQDMMQEVRLLVPSNPGETQREWVGVQGTSPRLVQDTDGKAQWDRIQNVLANHRPGILTHDNDRYLDM